MDALPAAIGRYEVKAFIARGGMGTLYLASDPVLQRQVAIKLLREADNDDLRARFTREVRAAANLRHRNIVTIFDVGDHNGQPFMAMEYIHGQTVASIIATEPPPSTIRRLQFIEDLCDGLAYAHKRGVVHRDIKPANLMVDAEGTLKILDFGIARAAAESGMTQAGLMIGTLNYMSPEQVAGTALDGRSDQFAVGAVFYELMARRQAFPGAIDGGVLNRILNGEPEPLEGLCPHLDPAIVQIVHRALRKNVADRFEDLLQMRAAVAAARRTLEDSAAVEISDAETISTPGRPEATPGATPRPLRRGPDREELARRRAQQIEEHVGAAREALAAGRYDEAIVRCEEALLLDANQTMALEIAERARIARDEAAARNHLDQARGFLKSGELTSASHQVREALDLFPDLPDAIEVGRVIAEARLQREREQQRKQAFEALLVRGAEALDEGDHAAAVALADDALAMFPADTEAKQFKEQAVQALALRQRQERDQAARDTASEARTLFAGGRHADALAVLEQFWPAHPLVSQLWSELSADATRLAREAEAATAAAAAAAEAAADDAAKAEAAAAEAAAIGAREDARQEPPPAPATAPEATLFVAREAKPAPTEAPELVPAPGEVPPVPPTSPRVVMSAPVVPPPPVAATQPAPWSDADAKPRRAPAPPLRVDRPSRSPVMIYGAAAVVAIVLAGAGYFATRKAADTPATDGTSAVATPAAPSSTTSTGSSPAASSGPSPSASSAGGAAAASPTPQPAPDAIGAAPAATGAPVVTTTAADREKAIEPLRVSVRRLLRRSDYRNALAPAARGLAIDPKDKELLGAVSQIETAARTAATSARGAAGARPGSPSAARAAALMADAQQFSGSGRRDDAARAYWQAENLFKMARTEATAPAAAATPSPRPATVAENATPAVVVPPPAAPRPPVTDNVPAAAPPPAARSGDTPQIPPPPRPQAPDDEAQIRGALAAYAQGYRSLDVNAILRVYPKAEAQTLRNAFQEAREYDVQIDVRQVKVTGDRAVVSTSIKQSFRPKAGRAQENTRATEFELQKSGNAWFIISRR